MRSRLTVTRWIILVATIAAVMIQGCDRHDVGTEANNPAPSSNMTRIEAQAWVTGHWAVGHPDRCVGIPTPTSSMTPVIDSRSVLMLERVSGPVRLHDILSIDEGPGRENVCHRVEDLRDGYVFIDGLNNTWPDGWMPLSAVKWRVAGIIYSRG